VPPPYGGRADGAGGADAGGGEVSSLNPSDLARLGYPAPQVITTDSTSHYTQVCNGGMKYDIHLVWRTGAGGTLEGAWSIASKYPPGLESPGNPDALNSPALTAEALVTRSLAAGYDDALRSHAGWWKNYWAQSEIILPDTLLEAQWYREMYKFGSASRKGAPPITLQAVWTADNGKLPPWKGDFHNDLNTQLSYWPGYSSNHLSESEVFTDWLWKNRPEFERYTRLYYSAPGLNVPGVSTLDGAPMGGWIQYANSPTVSAWLAQHFYFQWRYGMDRKFLRERAWPWLRDAATFIDSISIVSPGGKRSLPLSSSPEINDNDISAWFQMTTNYDLALIRWLYGAAAELAGEMGLGADARRLRVTLSEWPDLATDSGDHRLLVAPGVPLRASHRHFSHLMAIHPLGILDYNGSEPERETIRASLADLRRLGPGWWTGYSYAWYGCLAARARDGETAAEALRTFATSFILSNGFHANGDQSKSGKSNFTYRPFTLEGNFAFAQGVQEMLLQSHSGTVRVFPAVPAEWKDISFLDLRTEGAFLVSATREGGTVREVSVRAETGGILVLENPFAAGYEVSGVPERRVRAGEEVITADLKSGETIVLKARR
jgi:alpha-L-fucosidase 2